MASQGPVVIVDPYGPVRHLAEAFRAAGYDCLRIQSTVEVPSMYRASLIPAHVFIGDIIHSGDWAATVASVAAYNPVAVVPGGEVGVEFADRLSETLGLPSNGTALSRARRDKYLMIETIKKAGLRGASQLLVTSSEQLAAWHRQVGSRVVIKPIQSAGGDSIHFCDNPEDSVKAYLSILGSYNIFSQRNDVAVAQEYLPGAEYMVDTVSHDGSHYICDMWRTTRICANGMIDLCGCLQIVPADGETARQLTGYAYRVLDALGIRFGPAHVEIKLTPQGPALVEVGARLAGGGIPAAARLSTGESQLEWTARAYVQPEAFHIRCREPYRIQRHCALVALISPVGGTLQAYRGLDRIEGLESFHSMQVAVRPGQQLKRTIDDLTYPVVVTLAHDIAEIVYRDMNTIRYFDGPDFYQLAS